MSPETLCVCVSAPPVLPAACLFPAQVIILSRKSGTVNPLVSTPSHRTQSVSGAVESSGIGLTPAITTERAGKRHNHTGESPPGLRTVSTKQSIHTNSFLQKVPKKISERKQEKPPHLCGGFVHSITPMRRRRSRCPCHSRSPSRSRCLRPILRQSQSRFQSRHRNR